MTVPRSPAPPDLAGDYAVSARQISDYQRLGHAFLRGVLAPDELAAFRPAILGAVQRLTTETRPLAERDTYAKAFLQVSNIWQQDEAVKRFTLARRFGRIAADLMGVDAVRLYHDQALFKEPGGGLTPWHQDQGYWPLDTDKTITMWMPLVDVGAEPGTMTFASESHALGYLGDLPISDRSEAEFNAFIGRRGFPLHTYGAMKAGDATWHAGWTLHGAPGNPAPLMREVMTIIFFADGTRVAEPQNPQQASDLRGCLPGLKPGDPAASPLNPVVYSPEILEQEHH